MCLDPEKEKYSERKRGQRCRKGPARSSVACVLMASGLGRRFGGNKLLAPFLGRPLLEWVLDATDTPLIGRRVAVTRHPGIAELCREKGVQTVLHDLPDRSDTVRLGLEALEASGLPDGCLFCPCDQPLLNRRSVEAMIGRFLAEPALLYRLSRENTPGSPVLFPRWCFEELKHLPAGRGGSYAAAAHAAQVRTVEALSPLEMEDVDTPEDLRRLEEAAGAAGIRIFSHSQ